MPRVLVAAGGTGGHVYPALTTAEVLRARRYEVHFVGGDRIEARLVPEAGFPLHVMASRGLPRSESAAAMARTALAAGSALVRSVRAARRIVRDVRPDVLLAMGSYVSTPPALAAASLGVPVVLHEQNAKLTLGHRLAVRWARALATSLPLDVGVRRRARVERTGNPIRPVIRELAECSSEERARRRMSAIARFGLAADATTVLVFGGSQGASAINEALPRAARLWTGRAVQVIHIAGPGHEETTARAWSGAEVQSAVLAYVDEMEDAYAAADLVVARSGATTVSELIALALPSVLVPLPQGPYQTANAEAVSLAGGCIVVRQVDDLAERLGVETRELISDPARRGAMGSAALRLAHVDAAERLADVVVSVIA